jgi:hypothetical protein
MPYNDVPLIRRMLMRNLLVFVVVKASPVFEPTVKPENVIVPALAPLVIKMSIAQSLEGAASVLAPLFVIYW